MPKIGELCLALKAPWHWTCSQLLKFSNNGSALQPKVLHENAVPKDAALTRGSGLNFADMLSVCSNDTLPLEAVQL